MANFLKSLFIKGVEVDTASATSGQVLQFNGTKFLPASAAGGASISDTPPSSPSVGQIWYESDTGKTFVYYDSFWVEVGGGGANGIAVCTSSTRPANPYEGQTIYETDTNRVLVYNASAWVMMVSADAPPGLQLIKTQTIGSGVGSVTVTNAFSSTYDAYQIVVSGGAMDAGEYGLNMTLGSTTTGYYYAGYYITYSNTNPWNLNGSNAAFWGGAGIATPNGLSANIFLNNPYLAKHTLFQASYIYNNSAGGQGSNGGYLANSTQYTDFTLAISASSMTGGTIRVYGYRNAI